MWRTMTEAAGGASMPMAQYGRYLQEQLRGLEGKSAYLSQATFERMHSSGLGYGYGWGVGTLPELGRVSKHNGSNGSYFAVAIIMRDKRHALAIGCNCYSEQAMADIEDFAVQLARRVR